MKNILITLLIFMTIGSKGQTIINIENQGQYMQTVSGAYYKDVNNILNPFEGTWVFTEGNRTLNFFWQKG